MEDTGLCTGTISFTGFEAGTVELSLGLHASRQLSDKVLRYLATETSHLHGWHPFYLRYGANLPSSLAWIFADTP